MAFEIADINDKKTFQSVRIPNKLRLKESKVYLKKLGNALYLIPYNDPWASLIEGIDSFTSDFMDIREQPPSQISEAFD
jgi:antitoxin VapB